MQAEIVSIGSELLQGAVADTNSPFIAAALQGIGIPVEYRSGVGDDRQRISAVLRLALSRVTVVIATGGLGPTADDCTREALADVTGKGLILHEPTLRHIEERFARRGLAPSEGVKRQALAPEGFTVLPNHHGTAPGLYWRQGGQCLVALPGPPHEMQPLFTEQVLPILVREVGREERIQTRVLKVSGMTESQVEEEIQDLLPSANPVIGLLASPGEVHIRVTARGGREEVVPLLDRWEERLRGRLGDAVFGVDRERLEEVVGRLLKLAGKTVAVAESCTGGLIAHRMTNVPGSSEYFERGVVSYSNRAKEVLLSVPPALIARCGAVSPEVAVAMAKGVRIAAGTDLGIGVTGIAGPTGGTPEKPVGVVYIALADARGEEWRQYRFLSDREGNKLWASQMALEMLRRYLLQVKVENP